MSKCKYPNEVCRNMTVLNEVAYCDSVPCSLKDESPEETEPRLNISCPCRPGDTIYVVDTDEELYSPLHVQYRTVECILITNDCAVLIKGDYYDDVICHLENLVTDKPYLDYYRCFLTEDEANKFIKQLEGERRNGQ